MDFFSLPSSGCNGGRVVEGASIPVEDEGTTLKDAVMAFRAWLDTNEEEG